MTSFQDEEFSSQLEQIREALPPGVKAYLVGGAIRDWMLRLPIKDMDLVLEEETIPIARQVANSLNGAFYALDVERDTARIILRGSEGERRIRDFARQRGEGLESDLRDRDFTINAMAMDIDHTEQVIDPLHGAADLHAKVLRACSSDAIRNDPLRALRAVRFATTFELRILPETLRMVRQGVSGMQRVSSERIRDEIFRILDAPRPATSLKLLDSLGAIEPLFPEIAKLKGVQQPPPHVQEAWMHSVDTVRKLAFVIDVLSPDSPAERGANLVTGLLSLKLGRFREQFGVHFTRQLNTDRSLRALLMFAALYHDAGKPEAMSIDDNEKMRFFKHEQIGATIVGKRSVQLHLSNVETVRLETIVRNHMRPLFLGEGGRLPSSRAVYRFFRDTGEAGVDVCLLSLADVLATYGHTITQEVWMQHLDVVRVLLEAWWERKTEAVAPVPLLDGTQIMQALELTPGPQIGEILEAIREAQAVGTIHNVEEALELARYVITGGENVEAGSGIDLA